MEKLTMTVKEMGKRLGISTGKAYELAKSEGFPVNLHRAANGRSDRGLMRWIEKQTNAPQHFEMGRR